MNNEIRVENWNGYNIRFVDHNGEWWAVAKDVTDALGIALARRAVSGLKDNEVALTNIGDVHTMNVSSNGVDRKSVV